jgi:hypothetical protein
VNTCLSHFPGLGGVFQQVPSVDRLSNISQYNPAPASWLDERCRILLLSLAECRLISEINSSAALVSGKAKQK